MKNKTKGEMSFSQRMVLKLNKDLSVILMKPGQDLYFRYTPKLEKLLKIMFDDGSSDSPNHWTRDEEKYKFITDVVKPILLYSIRNPNDYRKRLLVDNDQTPGPDQEYYDDFYPELDAKILEEQGYFKGETNTTIFAPQLTLFFIILRMSGWMSSGEEAQKDHEDVESFPEQHRGDEETTNSEAL